MRPYTFVVVKRLLHGVVCGMSLLGIGAAEGIPWAPSMATARVLAKRSGKPFLVLVPGDVGLARRMQTSLSEPEIVRLSRPYVPVKVTGDEAQRLIQRHGLRRLPALLFLGKDGKLVCRAIGFMWPADLREIFAVAQDARQNEASILAKSRAGVANADNLARLVQFYAFQGKRSEAETTVKRLQRLNPTRILLCDAYTAIGELHRSDGNMAQAAEWFGRGLEAATTPRHRFRAQFRRGLALRRIDRVAEGERLLASLTRIPNLSAEDRATAAEFAPFGPGGRRG